MSARPSFIVPAPRRRYGHSVTVEFVGRATRRAGVPGDEIVNMNSPQQGTTSSFCAPASAAAHPSRATQQSQPSQPFATKKRRGLTQERFGLEQVATGSERSHNDTEKERQRQRKRRRREEGRNEVKAEVEGNSERRRRGSGRSSAHQAGVKDSTGRKSKSSTSAAVAEIMRGVPLTADARSSQRLETSENDVIVDYSGSSSGVVVVEEPRDYSSPSQHSLGGLEPNPLFFSSASASSSPGEEREVARAPPSAQVFRQAMRRQQFEREASLSKLSGVKSIAPEQERGAVAGSSASSAGRTGIRRSAAVPKSTLRTKAQIKSEFGVGREGSSARKRRASNNGRRLLVEGVGGAAHSSLIESSVSHDADSPRLGQFFTAPVKQELVYSLSPGGAQTDDDGSLLEDSTSLDKTEMIAATPVYAAATPAQATEQDQEDRPLAQLVHDARDNGAGCRIPQNDSLGSPAPLTPSLP